MAGSATLQVGIDTGGTFTDAVCLGPEGRRACKLPSTPARPERAFLEALEAVGGHAEGAAVHHGTTVATNAVLTRTGARVALLVTAGFEDLPWLGRGAREDLHALEAARTPPLLAPGDCLGVRERMGADGRASVRLTAREIARAVARVRARDPQAVAVCLLHAVRNPAHEVALVEALGTLGVPVYRSSASCGDARESERAATVLLDAYVAPILGRYLQAVGAGLPSGACLSVMRSDGGRMAAGDVAAAPARTLLSGPAAGVAAAQELAARHGLACALSFDVGGTSTDVAWIEGDDLPVGPSLRVGPFRASLPSAGLETVGAGGGSVVWLDTGGALRVGPASAGADPGPACYGRGGPFVLTDAWLLGGQVPPRLLDGALPLDRAAAERAGRALARRAGLSLPRLCAGAREVAAAATARALRLASVAQGRDPRRAALVAFGGAGPVLATATAARLGIGAVYVPPDPGTFAAEGALRAPLRADAEGFVGSGAREGLGAARRRLEGEVRGRLREEGARGVRCRVEVEARYPGQAFTVRVPYGRSWRRDFHDRHEARYGFARPEARPEPVSLHVRGTGREGQGVPAGGGSVPTVRLRTRAGGTLARASLAPGARVRGPARLEELTGTTWVPRGWWAEVLGDGVLRLRRAP
jgi:N-methylhydantoinase A